MSSGDAMKTFLFIAALSLMACTPHGHTYIGLPTQCPTIQPGVDLPGTVVPTPVYTPVYTVPCP